MRYGADTTVGWFLYNQAVSAIHTTSLNILTDDFFSKQAVALGNMVGGSLIVGVGGFAVVHWLVIFNFCSSHLSYRLYVYSYLCLRGSEFLHPKQPEDLMVSVPHPEKEDHDYGMDTPGILPS